MQAVDIVRTFQFNLPGGPDFNRFGQRLFGYCTKMAAFGDKVTEHARALRYGCRSIAQVRA